MRPARANFNSRSVQENLVTDRGSDNCHATPAVSTEPCSRCARARGNLSPLFFLGFVFGALTLFLRAVKTLFFSGKQPKTESSALVFRFSRSARRAASKTAQSRPSSVEPVTQVPRIQFTTMIPSPAFPIPRISATAVGTSIGCRRWCRSSHFHCTGNDAEAAIGKNLAISLLRVNDRRRRSAPIVRSAPGLICHVQQSVCCSNAQPRRTPSCFQNSVRSFAGLMKRLQMDPHRRSPISERGALHSAAQLVAVRIVRISTEKGSPALVNDDGAP